jgi:hypothetical protein
MIFKVGENTNLRGNQNGHLYLKFFCFSTINDKNCKFGYGNISYSS